MKKDADEKTDFKHEKVKVKKDVIDKNSESDTRDKKKDSLAVIQDFIKEQQEEDSDEKTDSKVVNIDSDSDSTKKTNENDLSQSGDERTEKSNSVKSPNQVNVNKFVTLIDWCLTPTLAIFELYHGVFYIEQRLVCAFVIYLISSSLHYALVHPYLHLAIGACLIA